MARCSHFDPESKSRCRLIGLFDLCKDGDKFGLGLLCEEHAELIVEEYTKKLGWNMSIVRVSEEKQIEIPVFGEIQEEETSETQQSKISSSLIDDALLED